MSLPTCVVSPDLAQPPCQALTENSYVLEVNMTYRVTMPPVTIFADATGEHILQFSRWSDGDTNPIRTITLDFDTTISAEYVEIQSALASGTIKDAKTNLPIQGANIIFKLGSFNYSPAITDVNGYYSQNIAVANGYVITVTHPNYQTYLSSPFDVTGPITVDVALTVPPQPLLPKALIAGLIFFLFTRR